MKEEHLFLQLNGERVFATHHRPTQPASQAIVMCHPLGEEKLWAHRVFVTFARDFSAAGFAVLRFDFRGEGDSDRPFERSDFETRIQDACLAIDTVRVLNPGVTAVTLLGLRLGACVAASTAMRRTDVSRLLLWDPVVDGAAYMQTVLRANLMFQMALHRKVIENRDALVARLSNGESVNIDGYELTEPLFRQVSDFRLRDALLHVAGETLLVQINQDETSVKPELAAISETTGRCQVQTVQEEPFWREIKTFYQRAPELMRVCHQALEATP